MSGVNNNTELLTDNLHSLDEIDEAGGHSGSFDLHDHSEGSIENLLGNIKNINTELTALSADISNNAHRCRRRYRYRRKAF